MRALLPCGACVLALRFAPALRALELGEPLFQSVGDADSIPDNNVTALAQDAAGFVWIGTPNGLIRYDGFPENQAGTLSIRARELDNGPAEIEFADDGAGIAAEHLPRIFEPFFTTRRAEGSIGLGLHSIYNIVRSRLRGEIDVLSRPGHGTRFMIRIPRELPTPPVAQAASPSV